MKDLPCKDYKLPPIEDFDLKDSPCRKCKLDICPFDSLLDNLDKKLGKLYEFLDMDV